MPESRSTSVEVEAEANVEVDHSSAVTTPLERSYRRWLRLLPKAYRRQWQEDMVETFLAGALRGDEQERELAGYGKPPLAEVASIVALGLRLRYGSVALRVTPYDDPSRPVAWRDAWRRAWCQVAVIGLWVNSIWATVSLPVILWYSGKLPGLEPLRLFPDELDAAYVDPLLNSRVVLFGWLFNGGWLALAFVLAFLALLFGYRRSAALLGVVGVLPRVVELVRAWISDNSGDYVDFVYLAYLAVALFPVIALLAYVGGGSYRVRPRPWLWSWLAGVAVLAVLAAITWQTAPKVLLDPTGLYCLGLALAGAVYLPWLATFGKRPDRAWCLTLAILAVFALLGRVPAALPFWFGFGFGEVRADQRADWQWWLDSSLIQAAVAVAVALGFFVLAVFFAVPRAVFVFDEEEDLLVFASVDEAAQWMDAADVEGGMYPVAYLDDGMVLQPTASGVGTSGEAVSLVVTGRCDQVELMVRLDEYRERSPLAPAAAEPVKFANAWFRQEEKTLQR